MNLPIIFFFENAIHQFLINQFEKKNVKNDFRVSLGSELLEGERVKDR